MKVVEQIDIRVHDTKTNQNEMLNFSAYQGTEPVRAFVEFLLSIGLYSEITLEQKFSTAGIVMKRLKGEE
jgi:hypothetical protein